MTVTIYYGDWAHSPVRPMPTLRSALGVIDQMLSLLSRRRPVEVVISYLETT